MYAGEGENEVGPSVARSRENGRMRTFVMRDWIAYELRAAILRRETRPRQRVERERKRDRVQPRESF